METTAVQAIKLVIVDVTDLSKDALHIYIGLGVLFISSYISRKPLRSLTPFLSVFVVAILCEAIDMRDDLASLGYWRWDASLHDVLNTIFWPFVLFGLARWTKVLSKA